ncbi:flagellar hook-basal body complex protein FliE [Chitinibacteraceae bacterium HSL-7]
MIEGLVGPISVVSPVWDTQKAKATTLFSTLAQQMESLESTVQLAQHASAEFARDESSVPTHELMIRMEVARLDLSLALQVRNRMVEAIQEIYRTQI